MEIFGYNRTNQSFAEIISSEFAAISIGGNVAASNLMQDFSASYQRQLKPFFSLGDPNMTWVGGFPSGEVSFSKAAGAGGFFQGLNGNCGLIGNVTINATQGQRCATVGSGGGTIVFSGAMLQGVNIGMQAGRVEILEGAKILISNLEI